MRRPIDPSLLQHCLLPIIISVLTPEIVLHDFDKWLEFKAHHCLFGHAPHVLVPIHLNWSLHPAPEHVLLL